MERYLARGDGAWARPSRRPGPARLWVATALAILLGCPLAQSAPPAGPSDSFGRLPLMFEQGGPGEETTFVCRSPGYALSVQPTEIWLGLHPTGGSNPKGRDGRANLVDLGASSAAVRVRLVGANGDATASGLDPSPAQVNYFMGSDPAQWRTGVPTFGRVRFDTVYPGIDVVYYGNQQQLEYDFVVQPGARPEAICLEFSGASVTRVDARGDLVLQVGSQAVRFKKPLAYQEVDGRRSEIPCRYLRDDAVPGCVRFEVGDHDPGRPLIIDPVLAYGTFLGGTGLDRAWSVVVDAAGSAYVAGETFSRDFPVTNAFDATFNSLVVGVDTPTDVFVAKLDPAGTNLVFATYLGGTGDDVAFDLALDSRGDVWLTGATYSTNFPTTPGALWPDIHTTTQFGSVYDAFVTKLSGDGSTLQYSTFLGGKGNDNGLSLAIDPEDNVLVAGFTQSNDDFPIVGVTSAYGGGSFDAFVTKLAGDGSQLLYSRFLGGDGQDRAESLAVDAAGQAVVAGWTTAGDFPITNAVQSGFQGGGADGFVAKLSADGVELRFSTFLGGTKDDKLYGVALDTQGNVYVTGYTFSTDFPTRQAIVSTNAGGSDVVVAKLDASGTNLFYSTYLGGKRNEEGWSLAVDGLGGAWVAGYTASTNFPTVDPIQAEPGGVNDAFLIALSPGGTALDFSTYLGGTNSDEALTMALDPSGGIYLAGVTYSTNFAALMDLQSLQRTNAGRGDAFVLKLSGVPARLRAELIGINQVNLHWPKHLAGFVLETADTQSGPFGWRTVPVVPVVVGNECTVALPASALQSYFRLRR